MPKISVIIPVYNVEKYLRECLDSVLIQTFENLEIICINDASTDGSLKILEEYSKRDSRIKIINNEKNIGLGLSRNKGIEAACGKYIHFLDSDDWMETNTYSKLYEIIENNDLDFLKFILKQYVETDEHQIATLHFPEDIDGKVICPGEDLRLFDMLEVVIPVLYKKSFILDNGLKFEPIIHEDTPFYLETLVKAERAMFVNDALYNYRIRSGSIMNRCLENFDKYLKWFDAMKQLSNKVDNQILSNKIYERGMVVLFDRYYHFIERRPICSLKYVFVLSRIAKGTQYENSCSIYQITKTILKKYIPTYFKLYLKLKRLVIK